MGVRVDGAAGPLALGAKGFVRDWLTPPGRAPGFRPRELYSTAALARHGALSGAIFYAAFGGENLNNRPAGVGNAIPLWWVLSNGVMSLQESIETYSVPRMGESPAQPDKGEPRSG